MKSFNILIILILQLIVNQNLFSQWQKIETPKGRMSSSYMFFGDTQRTNITINGDFYYKKENETLIEEFKTNFFDTVGNLRNITYYNDVLTACFWRALEPYVFNGSIYQSTDFGKTWSLFPYLEGNKSYFDYYENKDFIYYLGDDWLHKNDGLHIVNKKTNEFKIFTKYIKEGDSILIQGSKFSLNQLNDNELLIFNSNRIIKYFGAPLNDFGKIQSPPGFGYLGEYIIDAVWSGDTIAIVSDKYAYYTFDNGESWEKIYAYGKYINIKLNKGEIFASTSDGKIYKYDLSTKELKLVFDDKNLFNIYLLIKDNTIYAYGIGMFYSEDNGNTWVEIKDFVNSSNLPLKSINRELYLPTYNASLNKTNEENNYKWDIFSEELKDLNFTMYNLDIQDSLIFGINRTYSEAYISTDFGKTWSTKSINIAYPNNALINKHRLFAVSNIAGKYVYSDDIGDTWIEKELMVDSLAYPITYIYKDNEGILYGLTKGIGMFKSIDNGENWERMVKNEDDPMYSATTKYFANYHSTIIVTSSNFLLKSDDNGSNWRKIIPYNDTTEISAILNYKNNYFLFSESKGFYYSTDEGETWTMYNDGFSYDALQKYKYSLFRGLVICKDKLFINFAYSVYYLPFSDLGIEYTSVENTEQRNYLYTYPAYPQPSRNEIKIKTYWDSTMPLTTDDVQVYDINGIKVTPNDLRIINENIYSGHIIVDASNLQKGVYFIKISHGTEMRVSKVIVE